MTITKLVDELLKREGGSKQINKGQMREVVKCLSELEYELREKGDSLTDCLYKNGKRRKAELKKKYKNKMLNPRKIIRKA